jgi:hypothetical protein
MSKITIIEKIFEPKTWIVVEEENPCAYLFLYFSGKWPKNARIYHKYVAHSADVTPQNNEMIERLQELTGDFFVVLYPDDPTTIFIIIAIIVAAVAIGVSFLLRPGLPNVKNQQETSPNNQLSNRQNKERPNERIPDIYGRLWATPDLIQVPYRIFNGSGQEVEYSYMCLGRGSYTIDAVRDDLTPISAITGSSVEVYGPFTSPNSGGVPQLRVGTAIGELIKTIRPLSSVNGQVLLAPNLAGAGFIGPFVLGDVSTTEIWVNFVAESGSYQVDGTTGAQTAVNTTLQIELTPCDAAGNATGGAVTHNVTLNGSATAKSRIGVTLKVTGLSGIYKIRAQRTTNAIIAANVSVGDEVQWRDAMAVSPVSVSDFGNVTTVQSITLPTPEALALKSRKLNMLVTRNVLIGTLAAGVVTMSLSEGPTLNAADIIRAMCLDAYIGNRDVSEVDTVGIYTAIDACKTYFGTDLATQFCFTFDDSKVSFEESLADVAAAVFCTAFRRGSIIGISLEKLTANSTLLFNHRNKIPNTETRTCTFGTLNDFDGIEFTYNEPNAPNYPNVDTPVTLFFGGSVNPKKITAVGIRNNVQAHFLAARLYNKLLYQNTVTQFQATKEAAICVLNDRILVADNTRPDTQDGEIMAVNGLEITTSQPVVFIGGHTYNIFLQHPDATVESLGVVAGSAPNMVVISGAPTVPLISDPSNFARTGYIIVDVTAPSRSAAFLVAEKTPQNGQIFEVKATNYDSRFYNQDQDFINNLITWNGPEGGQGGAIPPGATYRPTLTNDIGTSPTAGLTDTTGDVNGQYDPADPTDCFDGDCIWSGFPAIQLTTNVTLYVTASLRGNLSAALQARLDLNGTSVAATYGTLGSVTYTVVIGAGTWLNTVTVEAFAQGTSGFGGSFRTSEVDITDIYIS